MFELGNLMLAGCTPSAPAEQAGPASGGSAALSEAHVAARPSPSGIENLSASAGLPRTHIQDQSRTRAGHSKNMQKRDDEHQRAEYASQVDARLGPSPPRELDCC